MNRKNLPPPPAPLLDDITGLIDSARGAVARTVNSALTLLYWEVGLLIRKDVLQNTRAEYGKEVLPALSAELVPRYGKGFSYTALTRMVKFAEVFPDRAIVATLSQQLSWSHFIELLPLEKPLQRDYYAEMCRIERWSVRTLRSRIDSMLYERTALSRKPEELVSLELSRLRDGDRMSPEWVFRDPYILDFLGLQDRYLEKDLEDAILRDMESFLLELGTGFTFVARQKRLSIGADDFYLDLLFYHRDLRRLVALELKIGKLKPAYKGQMELYLRWLDKYERKPGEETPIGLILCAEADADQVELLELDQSGIHVAEYLTTLPPREWLSQKLHAAIEHARERFIRRWPALAESQSEEQPD